MDSATSLRFARNDRVGLVVILREVTESIYNYFCSQVQPITR